MAANNAINNTLQTPFNVGATSVTTTGTQLNLLNAMTVIPFNKVNIQVKTTTGTYTPTTGTKYAIVELWGAGGGGGASASATTAGGSGGGGAYSSDVVVAPTAVTIAIGAGGTGQLQNNGTAGTDGGDTTYNTTTIVAKGGSKGSNITPGAGGTASGSTGTKKISGGQGAYAGVVGLFLPGGNSAMMPIAFVNLATLASPIGQGGIGGIVNVDAVAGGAGYAVVTEFISS